MMNDDDAFPSDHNDARRQQETTTSPINSLELNAINKNNS